MLKLLTGKKKCIMITNELNRKSFHIPKHKGNTPGSGRRIDFKK